MQNQKVLILDFGGQYNQLIARRVRENNVYCEVHPYDMSLDAIRAYDPCLSCATHALGKMPLEVTLVDAEGTELDRKYKA